MAKLGLGLGIVLLIAAAVILFFVAPQDDETLDPNLRHLLGAVVCAPGETYHMELGGYVYNSADQSVGQSFNAYCLALDETERDVTAAAFGVQAAMFVVPFVTGLLLTMVSANVLVRSAHVGTRKPRAAGRKDRHEPE